VKTAIEWVRRARETGERTARRQGQPKGSKLDPHEAFLLGLVVETADITLVEMQARLRDERGVSAGTTTLWRFFDARGCLIPEFDGAISTPEWKDALWAKFFTAAPRRRRRSVERYSIVKRA